MLLEKNKEKIFFVHIPRTGGRYATNMFLKNGFKTFELYGYSLYKGIEDRHLHHEYLKEFDCYNNTQKFAIVRDPLSRFIGAATVDMSLNKNLHNLKLTTTKDVLNYIQFQQNRYSFFNNWFRPQYEFVSKDCKIWKLENGLKDNFLSFIKKEYNINLKFYDIPWKYEYDGLKKIRINKAIKEAVKIVYKKDYERFYI
jgi:hypothetical protein